MLNTAALVAALTLVAVWLVYPLTIALIARMRRPSRPIAPVQPRSISVVLATREDEASIRARVQDFLEAAGDDPSVEMIVAIDAASAASTGASIAGLDPRVKVVIGDPPGGKAVTLNAGVRAASGEVVVFTDTHQRFEPGAISRLAEALADPEVGAASGCLELNDQGGRSLVGMYWRFERWLRRTEARVHSSVGVTGAIYAVRKADWRPLPAGLILDDLYVPMRLVLDGRRIAWVEDARARETRRFTWAQEYRRKVRTLTGNFQLCAWLPGVLLPHRNPIWTQFVFHKLLRLLNPYLCAVIALWAVARVAGWLGDVGPAAFLAAGIAVAAPLAVPRIGRAVRSLAVEGVMMQAAVFVATINGLRGRWDVWTR
ncbi:MAG TPA: glycosyltransferase [Longimicrobiales bacterium]|nr:glycosyltransferase [Longimicrobiales bacterium]